MTWSRVGQAPAPAPVHRPPARALRSGRFAERLEERERTLGAELLKDAARSIARGQALVDSVLSAARRGKTFSNEELLAVQAGVYRYTQELELASKLVDKASGAVRTTLQSQQ